MRSAHALAALGSLLLQAPISALQLDACVWSPETPSPLARYESGTLSIDDELWLFGGFVSDQIEATARVDVYDPASGTWTPRSDLPVPVTHVGLALDDRTVWMVGGFVGDHPGPVTDAVWTYDVDADVWTPSTPLPEPVGSGALVRRGRDLHYFGGIEPDRNTSSPDHWVLDLDDPAAGWSPRAPLPEARCHLAGVEVGGYLYAAGGQFRHDFDSEDQAFVHRYDPQTDTWTERQALPVARSHHETSSFVHGGRIFVMGGRALPIGYPSIDDAIAYDPVADTWTTLPSLPGRRLGASAALIGGRIHIACGTESGLAPRAETWSRSLAATLGGELRIDAGGTGYQSPVTGQTWCSDHLFFSGQAIAAPGVPIVGTPDDELYRTARSAADTTPTLLVYRIPTDPGEYLLRLHFAEIGGALPGARVFDVRAEGTLVLDDFDIASTAGPATAWVVNHAFQVTGGSVLIRMESSTGRPLVNAIELVRLGDPGFESFCASSANSTGSPALMGHQGSAGVSAADLQLTAGPVPDNWGLFYYGMNETQVPFGNGTRCIDFNFFRLQAELAQAGVLRHDLDYSSPPTLPGLILPGSTWSFQAWYRDPAAGGSGFDFSDGLRVTFGL